MTVFANGLEVACKAQNNKVIAAFPDVCFTPPENPATPPGVPVPYPSFGMDSDTAKGTGTVKIGGETITQKNKSYYSKTTGTEAGCAAKKGVITSKNTGKEYAHAWSGNVKAEGEPISRFSDISTNNHASPGGQTPLWVKIGKLKVGGISCTKILADIGIEVHPYNKKRSKTPCKKGYQSDHIIQNAFFESVRGGGPIANFPNYSEQGAPAICLYNEKKRTTQHGKKSRKQIKRAHRLRTAAGAGGSGTCKQTYKEGRDAELKHTEESLPKLAADEDAKKCLKLIVDTYFKYAAGVTRVSDLEAINCDVPKTGR